MGIDVDAYLAVGTIINITENSDLVSKEFKKEWYEEGESEDYMLQEYLYEKMEDTGIEVFRTNEYSEELVLYVEKTYISTSWDGIIFERDDLLEGYDENIHELTHFLEENNIKYDKVALVLFPYYSY